MGVGVDKLRTTFSFFLIIFFIVCLIMVDVDTVLASSTELTELEIQQLKILQLSKIVEVHPSTIDLEKDLENYQMGLKLYHQGDYQQAISALWNIKYSTLNLPLYIKSQYILGDCFKRMEDWDGAIEIYKNLVKSDPLLTDYSLFYLADTYRFKGDYRESITAFKEIIKNFSQSLIISEAKYRIAQNYL